MYTVKKQHIKRYLLFVGAPLLVVVLLTATIMSWPKPQLQANITPNKVRTGFVGEYAGLIIIAKEQGFFAKNNLDVSLENFASGPETLSALLAGKLDTAIASDFAGVRSSFKGEDLQLLSTISKAEAFYLVGRSDRGITSNTASLKGKAIGFTQKTVGEFYVGQFLTFNNIALTDITTINKTQAQLVEALHTGQIDAAALFQPNAYKAQKLLGKLAVTTSIQSTQDINTLLYSTSKYTSNNPDIARRYIQALSEAEQYVRQNNGQAKAIIAKHLQYDTAYIDAVWPHFRFALTIDESLLLNMEDEARWAIENHLTDATKTPNYFRLIYFDALQAVNPEAITVVR